MSDRISDIFEPKRKKYNEIMTVIQEEKLPKINSIK